MNRTKIFSVITSIFFVAIWISKQYWFLNQLNMKYSNNYHIFISLGSSILLFSVLFLIKNQKRVLGMLIMDFFYSAILFSDLVYYRYFGDFITIPVLSQSNQTLGIKDSILYLIQPSDLAAFISIPFWILCLIFNSRFKTEKTLNWKKRLWLTGFSFTVGAAMMWLPVHSYVQKNGSDIFEQSYSNAAVYRITGIVGFHGWDIKKYVEENYLNKKRISKEELQKIDNWFTKKQKNDSKDAYYGMAKGKNIIVFQFESLQSFVIGKTVNGQEITPNLNKLAKESFYFSNIFDQTGQGRTSDAEILVNASLHPLPTGSVHVRFPGNTFDSTANNLKEYGAYSFHGNTKSFWNRYLAHTSLGFDKFYSIEELNNDEVLGPFLSDGSLLKQTATILSKKKQPFYAFIVGVSSHHPFNFTNSKNTIEIGKLEGTELGDYLHAVNYVDAQIGQFIEQLKQSGLWDKSIFITYGDHNTTFIKKSPLVAEFLGMELNSPELSLEDIRIPLIFHVPGGNKDAIKKVDTVGGLIDTAPTLFHLLGKEKPKYMFGENLLTTSKHYVVLRDGGFVSNDLYFNNRGGNEICYDLKTLKETTKSSCQKVLPSLLKRLDMSDKIIKNNLIEQLKK
ncbi:LTA synthase family protein [Bacillus cereus]